MTTADPLAALITELEAILPAEDARVGGLRAVSASLARHNSAPDALAARGERRTATALMMSIRPAAGPVLAIDSQIDWDLAVPEEVTAEAAQAAGVLARLARHPALSQGWTTWHARFLDRYGPGAVVPVLDAVDDTAGIGFPAGYLSSPDAEQKSPLSDRDKALIGLAQRAVIRRDHQIVLDDALIGKLAAVGPGIRCSRAPR